jgi:hypothetical protein
VLVACKQRHFSAIQPALYVKPLTALRIRNGLPCAKDCGVNLMTPGLSRVSEACRFLPECDASYSNLHPGRSRRDMPKEIQLRLLHMMNVRFSLLNMAQRILGVTLPNF